MQQCTEKWCDAEWEAEDTPDFQPIFLFVQKPKTESMSTIQCWDASFYLPSLCACKYHWRCCRHLSTGIISFASWKLEILKINLCQGQHRNHWFTPYFNARDLYLHFHNADLSNVNQRKTEKWKVFKKKFLKNTISFISPDKTSENEGLGFCWA